MSSITPSTPLPTTFTETQAYQQLSAGVKDILTKSYSTQQLNSMFLSATPVLPAPTTLKDFFTSLSTALTAARHQFQLNESVQQDSRIQASQDATTGAMILASVVAKQQNAKASAQSDADAKVLELTNTFATAQAQIAAQNAKLATLRGTDSENWRLNSGNLITAYNTFLSTLTTQNAIVIDDDGTVHVTNSSVYNTALNTYLTTPGGLNDYNAYLATQMTASGYDASAYNALVMANTSYFSSFVSSNKLILSQAIKDSWVQPSALPYSSVAAPTAIALNGTVTLNNPKTAPYAWVERLSAADPNALPNITYNPTQDANTLATINKGIFDNNMLVFNQAVELAKQSIEAGNKGGVIAYYIDPIDNAKPLIQKLLNSFIEPSQVTTSRSSSGTSVASNLTDSNHITAVLGKAIVTQVVKKLNLHLDAKEEEDFINRLLTLSTDTLNENSILSIMPAAGILSPQDLTSLSANSPILTVIFAISFVNRNLETVGQGLNAAALNAALSASPELNANGITLTPEQVEELLTAINTGLILTSVKFLATSLGLPDLLPQLLAAILPPQIVAQITGEALTENANDLNRLLNTITASLVSQGFTNEAAAFIAQFSVDMLSQGQTFTPSVSVVSGNDVQIPLLTNSVVVSLLVAGYTLDEAQTIASRAVNNVLDRGTLSYQQFIRNLEYSLRNQGVPNSSQVASQAVIVTNNTNPAALLPQQNSTVVSETPPVQVSETAPVIVEEDISTPPPIPNDTLDSPPLSPANPVSPTNVSTPLRDALVNPLIPVFVDLPIPPIPVVGTNIPPLGEAPLIRAPIVTPVVSGEPTDIPVSLPVDSTPVSVGTAVPSATPGLQPTDFLNLDVNLLSYNQIIAVITEKILMLIPALDPKLKQELPLQLAITLFGTANPDSADIAGVKLPTAVINVLRNAIYHLKIEDNSKYFEAVATTFKDTIRDSVDMNVFLLKLLDPANEFIYSVNCGIMYAGHEPSKNTKSIDIIV